MIAVGRVKHAALYFEYVIPFDLETSLLPQVTDRLVPDLIPPRSWRATLASSPFRPLLTDDLKEITLATIYPGILLSGPNFAFEGESYGTREEALAEVSEFLRLYDFPVLTGDHCQEERIADNYCDIRLSLPALNLVDVSKASWDQIISLREDQDSWRKLRNLRLFLFDNYAGREVAFVEDKLESLIDEYLRTAKEYGFETKQTTLDVLFDPKTITEGGTLLSFLAGASGLALPSLIAGFATTLGRLTLKIDRARYSIHKSLDSSPVKFIVDARKAVSDERKSAGSA